MKTALVRNWVLLLCFSILYVVLIRQPGWWEAMLGSFFPQLSSVVFERLTLSQMVLGHLRIVSVSSGLTILTGIPLGILLTRPSMKDFLAIANNLIAMGQTFPPVAVLALTVPVFGFGLMPTIAALFLYGLLPIVRNTIAGMQSVPRYVLDAAAGIGMHPMQILWRISLPLSAPVILTGVRISVIINIGTAMIGAVIGADGLGSAVIAGLVQDNLAFVLQGVLPAVYLTVLVDQFFHQIEGSLVLPERSLS